jgi:hypothetical protein
MARVEPLIFHGDQSMAPDILAPWPLHPSQGINLRLAADGIATAFRGQNQAKQDRSFQSTDFHATPYNTREKKIIAVRSGTTSPPMTVKREDTSSPVFSTSNSPNAYRHHATPHVISSSSSQSAHQPLPNNDGESPEPREATSSRRRRRSPTEMANAASSSAGKASSAGSSGRDPGDERRSRNRIAATKSRRRKKQVDDELADHEQRLRSRNRQLAADAARLRGQVLELKNQILSHGACNSQLIYDYLANEAKRLM